jgi:predicted thioredoxin/glutaredoxin
MKKEAIFYHDGCKLCLSMAEVFGNALDPALYVTEVVNLGIVPERTDEAGKAGVTVLPSLVVDGKVFAINPHSGLQH